VEVSKLIKVRVLEGLTHVDPPTMGEWNRPHISQLRLVFNTMPVRRSWVRDVVRWPYLEFKESCVLEVIFFLSQRRLLSCYSRHLRL
jgi:hypothetical protein